MFTRTKQAQGSPQFFFPQTAGHTDGAFEAVDRFQHLGLNFGLTSQWEWLEKKDGRFAISFGTLFAGNAIDLSKQRHANGRAQLAVDIARDVVNETFRSVAVIDYYLKHVNDEKQLRELDRWLAEEILSVTFRNGHKKGNFRKLSFSRLRSMGLPSLQHRRRL